MDFNKKIFTTEEVEIIMSGLKESMEEGYIEERSEKNQNLLVSYKGIEGNGISEKWNVKIYKFNKKKNGFSLVCNDSFNLEILVKKDYSRLQRPDLKKIEIDDAGWGFPLCGIMVGVTDGKKVETEVVPVEYFQTNEKGYNNFENQEYLEKYTEITLSILETKFASKPETHRIEICTGFVNQSVKEKLRKIGYRVDVTEIKGLLQDSLENLYKSYVETDIGKNIYYDPKEIDKKDILKKYEEVLEFGKKNCPDKLKNGWKAFN